MPNLLTKVANWTAISAPQVSIARPIVPPSVIWGSWRYLGFREGGRQLFHCVFQSVNSVLEVFLTGYRGHRWFSVSKRLRPGGSAIDNVVVDLLSFSNFYRFVKIAGVGNQNDTFECRSQAIYEVLSH